MNKYLLGGLMGAGSHLVLHFMASHGDQNVKDHVWDLLLIGFGGGVFATSILNEILPGSMRNGWLVPIGGSLSGVLLYDYFLFEV